MLRRGYRFNPSRIAAAFRAFAGLPQVTLEDPATIKKALDWAERGIDFADALHLAKAEGCDAFLTFDRQLVRVARNLGGVPVRAP